MSVFWRLGQRLVAMFLNSVYSVCVLVNKKETAFVNFITVESLR